MYQFIVSRWDRHDVCGVPVAEVIVMAATEDEALALAAKQFAETNARESDVYVTVGGGH